MTTKGNILAAAVLALSVLTCSVVTVRAQDSKGTVRASSRDDLLRRLPDSTAYLLPEFQYATVLYTNGGSAVGTLNVCLVDNSVRIINETGDTLMLADADRVYSIKCGDTLLLERNGHFLRRVSVYGNSSLCQLKEFSFTEPDSESGYGGLPPTSTARQARVRSLDVSRAYGAEVDIPWELHTKWVLDDGRRYYPSRRSSFERIFPSVKTAIRSYVRDNDVDFNNPRDLIDLFQYCVEQSGTMSSPDDNK